MKYTGCTEYEVNGKDELLVAHFIGSHFTK